MSDTATYIALGTLAPVLGDLWDQGRSWTLQIHLDYGGYEGLKKAKAFSCGELIDLIKNSSLRGHGDAGFSIGLKWPFLPPVDDGLRYLVANADESEPGICKDIPTIISSPQALIKGTAAISHAVDGNRAFVYLRGEISHAYHRLLSVIREVVKSGLLDTSFGLGDQQWLCITVHVGAGAYICGGETALLGSLEGRRDHPRFKPPLPTVAGLYAQPMVADNVETTALVLAILTRDVRRYSTTSTEKSKGHGILSVSGHMAYPGQYEAPFGITMCELTELSGDVRPDHEPRFWVPGGPSMPIFGPDEPDVSLGYESMAGTDSMLGTRVLQVLDETISVVHVVTRWTEFYQYESCGKRTPYREDTYWMRQIVPRLEIGRDLPGDIKESESTVFSITGRSFCAPGDASVIPALAGIKRFREKFEAGYTAAVGELSPYAAPSAFEDAWWAMTAETTTKSSVPAAPLAPKMVHMIIDGQPVKVKKGILLIYVVEQVSVHISHFCDHPLLAPSANCHQCLVEVAMPGYDGVVWPVPKSQLFYTMTTIGDMGIPTQATSEVTAKVQVDIMEFLLTNHPLDCPVCDESGERPLQNQALELMASGAQSVIRFTDVRCTFPKPSRLTSSIPLDRDRCILCQRCARSVDQIPGDSFIAPQGRGGGHLSFDMDGELEHTGGLHSEQTRCLDACVLDFHTKMSQEGLGADPQTIRGVPSLDASGDLTGPGGGPGVSDGIDYDPDLGVGREDLDVSGRSFVPCFSDNTTRICPVGALISAKYYSRARPMDLVSTDSVTEHGTSSSAIRADIRHGVALYHLTGSDPEVNEKWITDKDCFVFTWSSQSDRLIAPFVRDEETGELVTISWSDALDVATQRSVCATIDGGVGLLPGGRLTPKDAWV